LLTRLRALRVWVPSLERDASFAMSSMISGGREEVMDERIENPVGECSGQGLADHNHCSDWGIEIR
jgi:hypothetical protein